VLASYLVRGASTTTAIVTLSRGPWTALPRTTRQKCVLTPALRRRSHKAVGMPVHGENY
jgi:hypothetical protein